MSKIRTLLISRYFFLFACFFTVAQELVYYQAHDRHQKPVIIALPITIPFRFAPEYFYWLQQELVSEPQPLLKPDMSSTHIHADKKITLFDYTTKEFEQIMPPAILFRACCLFSMKGYFPRIAVTYDEVDFSAIYIPCKNVIVLGRDVAMHTSTRKLYTLLHELAHAYQEQFNISTKASTAFIENHADRLAFFKLACPDCIAHLTGPHRDFFCKDGYFSRQECFLLELFFKRSGMFCKEHQPYSTQRRSCRNS